MTETRRKFLLRAGATGALAAISPFTGAETVFAKAPMSGNQALSIHRMKLGDFEVTTLLDGFIDVPPTVLMGDAQAVKDLLDAAQNAGRLPLRLPVNTFVINTGEKLVLIDTGGAKLIGPNAGRLPQALALAGIKPEDIDEVCITHMHGDHLHGAVTPEGKALLPNAILRIAAPDVDYWGNPEVEAKAPDAQKPRFVAAKRAVAAYGDRLKPFKLGDVITPGITSVPAPGHSPGHSCYLVQSGAAKLLLIGDLLHVAPVQFPRPETTVGFDWDQDKARASRKELLDRVVSEKMLIGAVHVAFPGIGALRSSGAGYVFDAIPWQLN
jgi:glyoxylase-like metal-dependent hydrolase (beta-lactamase superfamily II)